MSLWQQWVFLVRCVSITLRSCSGGKPVGVCREHLGASTATLPREIGSYGGPRSEVTEVTETKLLRAHKSCLLIVDVQEKLVPVVNDPEQLVANCAWLMGVASVLDVPMLISEQYPAGLGPTVAKLRTVAPAGAWMEKVHFSCTDAPACRARIEAAGRAQMVLAGIEAHVCVLQTALGLMPAGKEVFVVADAVSSRRPLDMEMAMGRMRAAGVQVVTKEMVLFEWAHQSATDQFRALSAKFLK